jgi:xanthine dehydrogenase accessory factor
MSRRFWHDLIETANGQLEVLLIPVMPPPALLICGAGHDALPVARLAVEMGWDCTLVDHRSGFARAERFPEACTVLSMQASELNAKLSLGEYDAAVVMSHHLEYDRDYLRQISQAGISYIGLLGPTARKDRLISEIGIKDIKIHGPAGLDIGAEMPESIALAIIAEIHAFLNQRQGTKLSNKTT